jgi:integrase
MQPKSPKSWPVDKSGRVVRRVKVKPGIYRSISGRLEVQYTDSDGKVRFETQVSPNVGEAVKRRRAILAAKDRGARIAPNPTLTFGAVRERWLADEVSRKPAENTRASLAYHAGKLPWQDTRMDRIGTGEVVRVLRGLEDAGYAASTVGKVRRAADAIFRFARRELGWAQPNPVADLDLAPAERRREAHRLHQTDALESPEVIAATLAAAGEPWRTLLTFIAETGLRESEALAVTWCDLHLDDELPYAVVDHQLTRATRERPARRVRVKTEGSSGIVPLTGVAVAALAEHKLRSTRTDPAAFVFATRRGTPLSQRNLLRALDAAQRRAVDDHGRPVYPEAAYLDDHGLLVLRRREDGKLVTRADAGLPDVHALRHTLASRLIADGASIEDVSDILRHRNSAITAAIYEHEIRHAEALRRRGQLLEALSNGKRDVKHGPAQDGTAAPAAPEDLMETRRLRRAAGRDAAAARP